MHIGNHSNSCLGKELSPSIVVFLDVLGTKEAYTAKRDDHKQLDEILRKYEFWIRRVGDYAVSGVGRQCTISSFSDCIFLSRPWCTNDECIDHILGWCFFVSGFAQAEAARLQLMVRGGIGIGSFSKNRYGVGGESIVEAFIGESVVAKNPVIVLSSKANRYLNAYRKANRFFYEGGRYFVNFSTYLDEENIRQEIRQYVDLMRSEADETKYRWFVERNF